MYSLSPFVCRFAPVLLGALLAACSGGDADKKPAADAAPDAVSQASPDTAASADWTGKELPVRRIPNVPENAEAYYAPDSVTVIAQTQDKDAQQPGERRAGGALTYIFTDTGENVRRINDRGQDACSWFFPDQKRIVFTSTRDNMDMPLGNWSDETEYPQGAELYISDVDGGNIQRLTNNKQYEAEVTITNDGQWVLFGRQTDGKMDIWKMRVDGTGEQQLTFTDDWQEGAPYPMPDGEHILFRAWKRSDIERLNKERQETGGRGQTPMTIFTMKLDGTDVQPRTFTNDMNWAPFAAPDGRHFFYVRVFEGNNWEVVMSDLAGGEPVRITWYKSFDGFPAVSPDGKKLLFGRSTGERFMSGIYTHVMDISSLNVGPENFKGSIPPKAEPPAGWTPDPALAAFNQRSL